MDNKKYKLGEKHKKYELYRVISLINFLNVEAGDVGGYIARETNLSQADFAWVYGNAQVFGDARVFGELKINYIPINIVGLKYSMTIFKKTGQIQVGCHLKTIKKWEEITEFEDQEFLDTWKEKILAFAK